MTSLHVLITTAKYPFLFLNFSWRYTKIAGFLRFLNRANWTSLKNKVEGVCNSHKLREWQVSCVCVSCFSSAGTLLKIGYLQYICPVEICTDFSFFFLIWRKFHSTICSCISFSVLLSLPGLSENYSQLNRSHFCGEKKRNSHHFKGITPNSI